MSVTPEIACLDIDCAALVKATGTASLAVPVRTACADCAHAILQSAAHQSLQTPAAHTSKVTHLQMLPGS